MNKTEVIKQLGTTKNTLKRTLEAMGWNDYTDFTPEQVEEIRRVRERVDNEGYGWMKEAYGVQISVNGKTDGEEKLIDQLTQSVVDNLSQALGEAASNTLDKYIESDIFPQMVMKILEDKYARFDERLGEYMAKKLAFDENFDIEAEDVTGQRGLPYHSEGEEGIPENSNPDSEGGEQ